MDTTQVLIVDDSATARMIARRCIQISGVDVRSFGFAENGRAAMVYLKNNPAVSAIVTDLNMPEMDGWSFLKQVKADPETRDIPVVVVSSIAQGNASRSLLSLGVVAVVKKPLSPAKMREAFEGIA